MKERPVYFCTECGNESPKWVGKCPACGAWNTLVEQAPERRVKGARLAAGGFHSVKPIAITDIDTNEEIRFTTGMRELDRVLGGGAVKGSRPLGGLVAALGAVKNGLCFHAFAPSV